MASRLKVLQVFKELHRTRQKVFLEDEFALKSVRQVINDEFRKHRFVTEEKEIENLIGVASESNEILTKKVIQLKEVRPNVYGIRKEHLQVKCTNARERCADCTCA